MRYLLFIALLFCSFTGSSQKQVAPTIGAGYALHLGWRPIMQRYSLAAGASVSERLFFAGAFGYEERVQERKYTYGVHYLTASLSAKFRFLDRRHWISPLLQLEAGTGFRNNREIVYFHSEWALVGQTNFDVQSTFRRVDGFGSLQLAADAKWKQLHFQLGGGLQLLHLEAEDLETDALISHQRVRWITSAGITYVIGGWDE